MHLRRGLAQAEREAAGIARRFVILGTGPRAKVSIILPVRSVNAAASILGKNDVLVRVEV